MRIQKKHAKKKGGTKDDDDFFNSGTSSSEEDHISKLDRSPLENESFSYFDILEYEPVSYFDRLYDIVPSGFHLLLYLLGGICIILCIFIIIYMLQHV